MPAPKSTKSLFSLLNDSLLAKSDGKTLEEHLCEVASYASEILELLPFERIVADKDEFFFRVFVAALFHDVGKAASGFQKMLSLHEKWGFRHEVLSAAVARLSEQVPEESILLILTHHRSLNEEKLIRDASFTSETLFRSDRWEKQRYEARLLKSELQKVSEALNKALKNLKKSAQSKELEKTIPYVKKAIRELKKKENELELKLTQVKALHEKYLRTRDSLFKSKELLELALGRGVLIASDHASSAGIVSPKKGEIADLKVSLKEFQKRVATRSDVVLEAPTGFGKTIAALNWLKENREKGERVFYVLPNRASVYAMYKTLKKVLGEDVCFLYGNMVFDYLLREEKESDIRETKLNRLLHKPFKVMTVHQILKYFFGIKRYEVGLAEMVGGLFVFDEIHVYEPKVLAMVLETIRLLRKLGGRFLFMSATIPGYLKEELRKIGNGVVEVEVSEKDPEYRYISFIRHLIHPEDVTLEELVEKKSVEFKEYERVLIIANRVEQCEKIFRGLTADGKAGKAVLKLHSRLPYRDRIETEKKVLELNKERKPHILVATQVVEVSLDVDYEVLFTEIAPVDALIQRFGRVNRKFEVEGAKVFLATEYGDYPYDFEKVAKTLTFLKGEKPLALNWKEVQNWMKYVYSEMSVKDRQEFEAAKATYQNVLRTLEPLKVPGHLRKKGSLPFGDTRDVLPISNLKEFSDFIKQGKIYDALSLMMPISGKMYRTLKAQGKILPRKVEKFGKVETVAM